MLLLSERAKLVDDRCLYSNTRLDSTHLTCSRILFCFGLLLLLRFAHVGLEGFAIDTDAIVTIGVELLLGQQFRHGRSQLFLGTSAGLQLFDFRTQGIDVDLDGFQIRRHDDDDDGADDILLLLL
jgi:hypothetical protein